jgi:hypothetical protein
MIKFDAFDVCAQIRMDWEEGRYDAGPSKKCPGGYSIPANKQCGGSKDVLNRIGKAGMKAYNQSKNTKGVIVRPGQTKMEALGGPVGSIKESIRQTKVGGELNAQIEGLKAVVKQTGKEMGSRKRGR